MSDLLADLRFTLRGWRKRPGIAALTVLTLTVGLAANTVIFGFLDALVLRPMNFPDVGRLVRIWETSPSTDFTDRFTVSPANFLDWSEQTAGVFEQLVAVDAWDATVRGRDGSERVPAARASAELFRTLGVTVPLGQNLAASSEKIIVIGDAFWRRHYGADAQAVGATLVVDGEPLTVVGVAPKGFSFPFGAELWAPLVIRPGESRDRHHLSVIGRLAAGRSVEDARAAMNVVAARLETEHPEANAKRTAVVVDLQQGFEDVAIRPILAIWQGAAVCLLLIACINVANLVLARASERRQELGMRLALGAGQRRIVRQLVVEGVVMGITASIAAVPIAVASARMLRDGMPAEIVRYVSGWHRLEVDGPDVAVLFVLGVVSALLFSVVPALRASRVDVSGVLRESTRTASGGRRQQWGRNALVIAEVAGALVLVAGAAAMLESAGRMLRGAQGFDPDRLLTLQVTLPAAHYPRAEDREAYARQALGRLGSLGGVVRVAAANAFPSHTYNPGRSVFPEGVPVAPGEEPSADYRVVSAGYLETMGIPLLEGRQLEDSDTAGSEPVAIVSRSLAERFWPGREAVGRTFRTAVDEPAIRVVGVCGDVIQNWFGRRNYPTLYRPYAQAPSVDVGFAARTAGEPEALAVSARQALAAIDPNQPAYDVVSQRYAMKRITVGLRYGAGIMGAFGLIGVILALSGVYAVMAYRVTLREPELGVRAALGASSKQLLALTLGQAMKLNAAGLVLGLALAIPLVHALGGAFGGAVPANAANVGGVVVLIAAASLVAAWLATRRAGLVNPANLLRKA